MRRQVKKVLEALVEANEKLGTTLMIITHNPGIAEIGDRFIHMNSGCWWKNRQILLEKHHKILTGDREIYFFFLGLSDM